MDARTPHGWTGRVEAVLPTGKVVVAHPETGLAWWFPTEECTLIDQEDA